MKQTLLIITLSLSFLLSCYSQNQNEQKGLQEITKLKGEMKELLTFTPFIDSDTESYWAYGLADSLLNNIDTVNFELTDAISDIYDAYSHIFYGMSYSKTVYYQSKRLRSGLESTFSEHGNIICEKELKNKTDFINCELKANFSMLYFYKVSNMQDYPNLYELYKTDSLNILSINKKYDLDKAYRINSVRLKKLNFKILVSFITDLHYINNYQNDLKTKELGDLLNKLGLKMDSISNNEKDIVNCSNTEFNENLIIEINVISKLIMLLNDELMNLTSGKN